MRARGEHCCEGHGRGGLGQGVRILLGMLIERELTRALARDQFPHVRVIIKRNGVGIPVQLLERIQGVDVYCAR